MNKKDILRLSKDSRYISGIYNYCDRWCERCHFTSRCLNYAIAKKDIDDPAVHDLNNKAFWHKLQLIFRQAKEMITEWAKEKGIDLNSLDVEAASNKNHHRIAAAKEHELLHLGRLRRKAEQMFPHARNFIRPGFDGADNCGEY